MNLSNGASFGTSGSSIANGNSMSIGSGESYGMADRDGSQPSAPWLFKVLVFRL